MHNRFASTNTQLMTTFAFRSPLHGCVCGLALLGIGTHAIKVAISLYATAAQHDLKQELLCENPPLPFDKKITNIIRGFYAGAVSLGAVGVSMTAVGLRIMSHTFLTRV